MHGNHRQTDFFWGALVGGTIATLTAVLFTSKTGKQLQHKLGQAYDEVEDTVKNALSCSKEKVEETADQAGQKIASKFKEGHPQKT